MSGVSADDLVAWARRRIERVTPTGLADFVGRHGIVADIRPDAQRAVEGFLPGAVIVERNVLEWRFDPFGAHRLPGFHDRHQPVVIVCSAGYASSLAAASLVELGLTKVADLDGGYLAWRDWAATVAGRRDHPSSSAGAARGLLPISPSLDSMVRLHPRPRPLSL